MQFFLISLKVTLNLGENDIVLLHLQYLLKIKAQITIEKQDLEHKIISINLT